MSLFRSPSTGRNRVGADRHVRLTLERLEAREVPSASPVLPHVPPAVAAFSPASPHASLVGALSSALHQASALPPVTITSVTSQNGQLTANGLIGNQAFSTPLTITTPAAATNAASTTSTPILTLHLAPIDLNVLGLEVKTSEICLNVSAQSGPGNLLGNLLGRVANLLNGGLSLSQILNGVTGVTTGLTAGELSFLTGPQGLQGLLNGAMGAVNAAGTTSPSATDILHLSLGPVNLNLLGLQVNLDNCAGGPVTVDVLANSGPGDLLGNLLTDVANLGLPTNLTQRLDQIAGLIAADAALLGL